MNLYKEIEKSFPKIEKLFTAENLLAFSQTLPGHLDKYDLGLGTLFRLKMLRPKSKLYREFIRNGFSDRNKMTMEIIRAFHRYVHRLI